MKVQLAVYVQTHTASNKCTGPVNPLQLVFIYLFSKILFVHFEGKRSVPFQFAGNVQEIVDF